MDSVAFRYAQALAQLAAEMQTTLAWKNVVMEIKAVVQKEPDLLVFLSHSEIPTSAKQALVKKIFADIPVDVLHFLYLLIDRKRIQQLAAICDEFHHLCNEQLGVQEGVIYSAVPLDHQQIKAITDRIAQELTTQLELTNQVDTHLISGIKVIIGDRVYDNSLAHQLSELRHSIMQGKR